MSLSGLQKCAAAIWLAACLTLAVPARSDADEARGRAAKRERSGLHGEEQNDMVSDVAEDPQRRITKS